MGIEDEIRSIFADFENGEFENQKMIDYHLFKETHFIKYIKGGFFYKLLENGEFEITRKRTGSFYFKNGNMIIALRLLMTGEYSGREVARIVPCSWWIPTKIIEVLGDKLKCKCGTPLKDHKGWCHFRFEKSETRKEFMKLWEYNKRNITKSDYAETITKLMMESRSLKIPIKRPEFIRFY
jgi:hypothetical protein